MPRCHRLPVAILAACLFAFGGTHADDFTLRNLLLEATDTGFAPWVIVPSDDKKRARLNAISHLLRVIPYKKLPREKIGLPRRNKKHAYDDEAAIKDRRFVREVF